MEDSLGDRMKMYEGLACQQNLIPGLPIVIRLDGVSFHTFTKGLNRPYDINLSSLMRYVTCKLVHETNACIGYTQSDEISLVLNSDFYKTQLYFNGRLPKILSVLAARCSLFFNKELKTYLPSKVLQSPVFDCRAFNLPSKQEVVNALIWREQDATRNSIQMAAQSVFSHNELQNKNCSRLQDMLFSVGINWNDYPDFFKRGIYIQKRVVESRYSYEELEKLPPKHSARKNPDLTIKRNSIVTLKMKPLTTVINSIDVIFNGEEPKYKE